MHNLKFQIRIFCLHWSVSPNRAVIYFDWRACCGVYSLPALCSLSDSPCLTHKYLSSISKLGFYTKFSIYTDKCWDVSVNHGDDHDNKYYDQFVVNMVAILITASLWRLALCFNHVSIIGPFFTEVGKMLMCWLCHRACKWIYCGKRVLESIHYLASEATSQE